MTYQTVSAFAQSWGLVFLVVMFSTAVVYALWPGNKSKFKKAAHVPLEED
ncbi:cbb3-type cytochrome c oxidase subunit 3 [Nisaea sp.]|jgi:cytochrome c oxidase cbb3-type subunit IV